MQTAGTGSKRPQEKTVLVVVHTGEEHVVLYIVAIVQTKVCGVIHVLCRRCLDGAGLPEVGYATNDV